MHHLCKIAIYLQASCSQVRYSVWTMKCEMLWKYGTETVCIAFPGLVEVINKVLANKICVCNLVRMFDFALPYSVLGKEVLTVPFHKVWPLKCTGWISWSPVCSKEYLYF